MLETTEAAPESFGDTSSANPTTVSQHVLWDSIGYFAGKVAPGFFGLISVPVFIRMMGLDQYGRFAVIVPLVMAVAGAGSGWIAQGILRFHPASGSPGEREFIFGRAVNTCTTASIFVSSVLIAASIGWVHESVFAGLASLAFCSFLLVYTVELSRLQALLRPLSVVRREAIRSVGGFVFPVLLMAITRKRIAELAVLGQALAYLTALVRVPGKRGQSSRPPIAAALAKDHSLSVGETAHQLWHFGWAVGLWLLLQQVLPVIDRWVIRKFAGYADAGTYASLYEIAIRSFSFLVFPLTQAAHPRIMRSWNEGRFAASYQIIRHSILAQVIIFVTVLGAVTVFSHRITRLILGMDDPAAAQMLPVLLLGGFLWQLALLLHKPLEIAQRTRAMLAAMTAVVAANVFACFLFIPRYGYPVAAYILTFSACAYIAIVLCMTRFQAFRPYSPVHENG